MNVLPHFLGLSLFPPSPATITTVQMKETCPPLVGACPLSSHNLLPKCQQGGCAVTHLQVGNRGSVAGQQQNWFDP